MPTQTAEKRYVVTIIAPPGSLGVSLIEDKSPQSDGCCMVDSIKDTSSLFGRIRKGDKLASIDDCSIRTWNLTEVVDLINQKAHLPERKIGVLRMSPEESSTSSTQTTTAQSNTGSTEDAAAAQDRARIVAAARAAAGYTGNNANASKESPVKKLSAQAFSRNVAAWKEHQRLLSKQKQNKAALKEVAKEKKAALKASQKKAHKKQLKVAKAKPALQKKKPPAKKPPATKPPAEKPPAEKPPAEKPKEYDPLHPVALRDLKPLSTHSVANRSDVRNELMRAFELHQGANTFEKMMQDEGVSNNPEASAKLKILIDKMRTESKIILDTSDSTLTIFEGNLKGLILFHQEHGHCSPIEKEDKGLYRFVSYQRGRYKRRDESRIGGCLGEDIVLLNRLGFEWLGVKAHGRSWEENVELLMAFKAEKGHTRVPQLYEMDGVKLGYWVSLQRKEYEKRSEGKVCSYITEERIDTLESIGFQWKLRFGRPKKDDPQYRNRRYGPFPNDAGELTTPIAPSNESPQGSEDGKLDAMDTGEASKPVANISPVLSPTRNLLLDEESEKALDTILNGSGRGSRELKSLLANDGSGGRIKRH
eukprot:scaffold143858_cov51-Attheya_sp.AAC.2